MDSIMLRDEDGRGVVLYLESIATRAEVTQNEESEFSLKISVMLTSDDPRYKFIKKGMLIEAKPDKWTDYDLFRIWSVKKKNKSIEIVAYHISYDMNGWIVVPFDGSKTYSQVMDWVGYLENPEDRNGVYGATSDNFPFVIEAGPYTGTATAGLAYPMTLREYLIGNTGDEDNKLSVAMDFGGHFVFHRYTAEHSYTTNTHSMLINSRYHASDFSVEDKWENYYSAVFPYYILNSSTNPVRIVPGQHDGATIIPTDSTPGAPIDYGRIYMLDVTDDFNGANVVSKEDVIAAAEKWMDKNRMRKIGWKPPFEVDVDYISIAQEKISVYDKALIRIPGESDEVFTKYIGETVYDLLKDRYTKLKFVDDNSNADNTVSGMLAGNFSNGNGSIGQNTVDAMSKNGGTGEVDGNSIIKVTHGDRTYLISRGAVIGYWFGDSDSAGEKWYEDFECTKRIALESRTVMFNFGQVVGGQHVKRTIYPDVRITKEYPAGTTLFQTEPLSQVKVKDNDVLTYDQTNGLYLEYTAPTGFTPSYLTKRHDPDGGYWLGVNISALATDLVASHDIATKTWVESKDYCSTGDVETIVTEALTNYYTKGTIDTMFGGYYTIAQTDSAISAATTAIQTWANGRFALSSAIPTLSDFVIQSWNALSTKAPSGVAINAHLNTLLGNYYTIAQTDSAISTATTAIQTWANGRFALSSAIPTLSDFVTDTWSSISTKAPNNTVISQYLSSNYYNKDDVDELFSGVVYDSDRDYLDGTYSGNNWISIKIHGITKNIPSGGSGGEPLFQDFLNNGGDVNGSVCLGVADDTKGFMPYIEGTTTWGSLGLSNRRWWNGYIRNLYVGTSSSSDVDTRLRALEGGTCLIAGTKIKMADGIEKNIEDVKTGDLIQSFDITTNQPVEAMALVTQYTGSAVEYDALVFDDGSSAEFYGKHSIYCNETKRLKEVDKWEVGLHSLDQNGNPIELSIKTKSKHHTKPNHYILISSNNLYYANGILMGHLTSTKYQTVKDMGLPASVIDKYIARLNKSDAEDQMALKPEFLTKAKTIMSEKHLLAQECDKDQVLLDKSDYSVVRTCERFLASFRNINLLNLAKSLGDLKEMIGDMGEARREEIRGRLGVKKDRLAEVTRQYNAFRRDYRKSLPLAKFADSVTEGNEDLETLKEWAKHLKENKNDHQ